MDKGKGKSAEIDPDLNIDEWMKAFLPDITPDADDIGMGRAEVIVPSSTPNSSNQPNKAISLGENYQVSAMTKQATAHGILQQQTSIGCHSMNPLMARRQELFNGLQHTDQAPSQNTLDTQSSLLHESVRPNLVQIQRPQNLMLVDQFKPANQSQTSFLGPSQGILHFFRTLFDSAPQDQSASSIDWVNRTFPQTMNVEASNKWERTRAFAETTLRVLNLSPSDLVKCRKERIYQTMNNMVRFFRDIKHKKSLPVNQPPPQQAEPSANHLQAPQMQQRGQSYPNSQMGFDQNALRMLLHPTNNGVAQNNISGVQYQTINSSRNIFNSLEYSTNSTTRASSILASPHQNKQRDAMKRPKMKHERNNPQMFQKRNEETNLREILGFNQKQHVSSPQNSQNSSSQIEGVKDLSLRFWKSATPSLSTSPSIAFPSPLTPLTPSSVPADCGKSPLCVEENSKITNISVPPEHLPLQDTELHTESQCPNGKQLSCANEDPVQRLVNVVKSISSNALNAALRDIDAVTNITDRIPGNLLPDEPSRFIIHDLAGDISSIGASTGSRIKRKLNASALNDSTAEMEFYASDSIKIKLKKEPNDLLLQDIKEINQKLIEVVVDVKDVSGVGSDKVTVVKCSYNPVGFSWNIKTPNTEMFPHLVLEFIVPADYPNSCPTVIETLPPVCRETEEGEYMWRKAKANFDLLLSEKSEITSVKEMAEAWNFCAAEVFHEFAETMGGGGFSSRYGKWENCVAAN
ncbi:hypothetical protein BUALT_Bualt12G0039000 [Buddleja alternifolia]|uniref:Uncharacterized protein n=1 Tax=Buddleja alternifolia TaxID=168488 RepID=A0AAV6WQ16_9LAMI|nr:hypothetical protein BUALT_Bualt12G0039000 [Buddleja alternifolia]